MDTSLEDWRDLLSKLSNNAVGEVADALCTQAIEVGDRLAYGDGIGVKPGEEGITDLLLINLHRSISNLRIRKIPRHEETKVGADWEWWIEGKSSWFGFLVQAKRLHSEHGKRGTYDIGYRPNSSNGEKKPQQIDALLKASRRLKIPAIYVLYNPTGEGGENNRPVMKDHCHVPIDGDGITAVGAQAAKWILNHNKSPKVSVESIAPHSFPWSCIAFCVCGHGHGINRKAPHNLSQYLGFAGELDNTDAAYAAAKFIYDIEQSALVQQFADMGVLDKPALDSNNLLAAVRKEPPLYAVAPPYIDIDPDGTERFEHPLSAIGMAPKYVLTLTSRNWG